MSYTIVGLGNPGSEYEHTRHNTGRIILDEIVGGEGWKLSKPHQAFVLKTKIGNTSVVCLKPETFMNSSGISLKTTEWNEKKATQLIIIHDELDIGLGSFKVSFNRSSGGHHGIDSVIKVVGTEGFIRIRVGISPVTASGKVKKPRGEAIEKAILGEFKPVELKTIKSLSKDIKKALELIVSGQLSQAMSQFNAR